MKTKTLIIGVIILLILVGIVASIIPKDDWEFKNFYNIFDVKNITAENIEVDNLTATNIEVEDISIIGTMQGVNYVNYAFPGVRIVSADYSGISLLYPTQIKVVE